MVTTAGTGESSTELLCDFVNSLDLTPWHEAFDRPGALSSWLTERGLLAPGSRVSARDLAAAKEVREAIRTLLQAHNGVVVETAGPLAVLDAAGERARFRLRFVGGSGQLEPQAPGVAGALGRIVAIVSATMADGRWERLKACRADDCRWVYLDTARNHSRAWCSMRSCGNRAKVSAYRERQSQRA